MTDSSDKFDIPEITEGYAVRVEVVPVRYVPYKKLHTQRTGQKGRWKQLNEFGGWGNCEKPGDLYNEPPIVTISPATTTKGKEE